MVDKKTVMLIVNYGQHGVLVDRPVVLHGIAVVKGGVLIGVLASILSKEPSRFYVFFSILRHTYK